MGPTKIDATLILLRSNHDRVRSALVVGYYTDPPRVGHRFEFFAPPLDPRKYVRWILTTPVQHIELMGDSTQFGTWNSLYRLIGRAG